MDCSSAAVQGRDRFTTASCPSAGTSSVSASTACLRPDCSRSWQSSTSASGDRCRLACLWVGGHAQWLTNSVGVGLLAAFALLIAGLLLGLMRSSDSTTLWILVRRAAGHDQREGVIGKIFMLCCMVGVPVFTIWFVLFSGAELAGVSVTQFTGGG